jgi:hypothetical protein
VTEEMKDAIADHQQGEESQSATVRRILRWGLKRASPSRDRRPVRLAATVAGLGYIAGYAMIGTAAGSIVGGAFIATMLVWASWPTISDTLDR